MLIQLLLVGACSQRIELLITWLQCKAISSNRNLINFKIHNSTFSKNSGGSSIVYTLVLIPTSTLTISEYPRPILLVIMDQQYSVDLSQFLNCLHGIIQFVNNVGDNGAAVFFHSVFLIRIAKESRILLSTIQQG